MSSWTDYSMDLGPIILTFLIIMSILSLGTAFSVFVTCSRYTKLLLVCCTLTV